jgi:outer membrane cobalamin receptor
VHAHEERHPPVKVDSVHVVGQAPPRSASEVVRSRDIIVAAPHRTASDVLQIVPGVFLTQHSGSGKAHQIFYRGFDAVHGQDLELHVGGIPVNEVSNVHGQGYADLHFVMPEVVREIHALPGSYDPRQGDFAVAGSMRLRLGYDEPGVTMKGTYGSFGTRRLFLAYHPKDAADATFAAFESESTDGFGPFRAADRVSALAQATHDFAGGFSARVLAGAYAGRYASPGVVRRDDVELRGFDRYGSYDPRQGGSSARAQVLLELHRDEESSRWSVAPFFIARGMTLRQSFTGYLDPLGDATQQSNDATTFGMNASYQKKVSWFSPRDTFEAGIYTRHDSITQSQRYLDGDRPPLVDATVRAVDVAGYVDASVRPFARFVLRGGLRADGLHFGVREAEARTAQGVHLGPKITADYGLTGALRVVGSYGEGFRSPQARALADGQVAPFTKVHSMELGLRYAQAADLRASLALFHTRLSEDLAFDHVTGRNERVPGTSRTGVSADLVSRPLPWMVAAISATYTRAVFREGDARYFEGDLLPYAPQLVGRTDLAVLPRIGALRGHEIKGRLGFATTLLARRPLPYSEMGKNIFLVDATAGARWREVELGLDVYNLLGASWYDAEFVYASAFDRGAAPSLVPLRHATVGAPRTILASFTLHI